MRLLCFFLFFSLAMTGQEFIRVNDKMLYCAEADKDYLVLTTSYKKDSFQWVWSTDICESVTSKGEMKFKPESGFTFWFNRQKQLLQLQQSYYSLLPEGIYFGTHFGKKLCIIEFSLVSYIGHDGYNYLIIDYSNPQKTTAKEVTSKDKKTVTNLIAKE